MTSKFGCMLWFAGSPDFSALAPIPPHQGLQPLAAGPHLRSQGQVVPTLFITQNTLYSALPCKSAEMSQVTNSRAALVLADEERQRKRERDRLYQKRKRERDRTLISKLKQRVETVESRLETAALPSLVSPYSERRPQSDNESDTKTSTTHCSTTCPVLSTTGDDTSGELMTGCANEGHNDNNSGRIRCISREIMQSEFPDTITEFLSPQCFPIEPSFVTADAEQQQEQPLRPDHWTTLSSLFLEAARPDEFSSLYEFQTFDSHVIITGVVHGWSEVANTFKLTPLLECLRNVDELALAYSGIVERMAALRIIALLIRVRQISIPHVVHWPVNWDTNQTSRARKTRKVN